MVGSELKWTWEGGGCLQGAGCCCWCVLAWEGQFVCGKVSFSYFGRCLPQSVNLDSSPMHRSPVHWLFLLTLLSFRLQSSRYPMSLSTFSSIPILQFPHILFDKNLTWWVRPTKLIVPILQHFTEYLLNSEVPLCSLLWNLEPGNHWDEMWGLGRWVDKCSWSVHVLAAVIDWPVFLLYQFFVVWVRVCSGAIARVRNRAQSCFYVCMCVASLQLQSVSSTCFHLTATCFPL